MSFYSPEYKVLLEEQHRKDKRWGSSSGYYIHFLRMCARNGYSLLDYGCGKGALKKTYYKNRDKLPDISEWTEYDPGIPGKDVLHNPKERFDTVVCIDVMEHIEPEFVSSVLRQIRNLSRQTVLFVIDCEPALTILPDGRNAHLTLHSPIEWLSQLQTFWNILYVEIHGTQRIVFIGE